MVQLQSEFAKFFFIVQGKRQYPLNFVFFFCFFLRRSDVLGHILPMVGRDWAQLGVAQLFSKIEANGYKLLYLSARAIGQSRVRKIQNSNSHEYR